MTEEEIMTVIEDAAIKYKDNKEVRVALYDVLDHIVRDRAPKTYEDACDALVTIIEDNAITDFKVVKYHHGLGTWIRNNWGLWKGWELHDDMKARFGLGHADDMSGLIMEAVECQLNGRDFDIEGRIKEFKEHWKGCNIDPLTQKQLN